MLTGTSAYVRLWTTASLPFLVVPVSFKRVRDRSADLGTTYARADTRVYANSSEVLSDVPSMDLLVDLSAPATDDSIASSTLVPPAQEHPAPHSSSTSGSIHPMVTRRS